MNHPMMDPFWGHLTGAVTVVLMLIFIGIWVWAWRKRHRSNFKRMSELPMEDKPEGPVPGQGPDQNNSKGRQP
jgi:cytochrome c oxidase cbb3-type subunit 4